MSREQGPHAVVGMRTVANAADRRHAGATVCYTHTEAATP